MTVHDAVLYTPNGACVNTFNYIQPANITEHTVNGKNRAGYSLKHIDVYGSRNRLVTVSLTPIDVSKPVAAV
jgi:hypothetical protein